MTISDCCVRRLAFGAWNKLLHARYRTTSLVSVWNGGTNEINEALLWNRRMAGVLRVVLTIGSRFDGAKE